MLLVLLFSYSFSFNFCLKFKILCADDNYDELSAAILSELNSLGPQAYDYVMSAVSGLNKLEQAVKSGDRYAIVQNLLEGAQATKAGAYHTISNPALYRLCSVTGPFEVEHLAYDVAAGKKNGQDVTDAIGIFAARIRAALQYPFLI